MIRATGIALEGRLAPLSLDVAGGKLVCLIGPNGSGKTSLLHALAGIGRPSGRVEIAGRDLRSSSPAQRVRLLSYLPAGREVHWPLAARDVIALSGASAEQVEAMIGALDLEPLSARRVDRLSTGERSRVLIARALAAEPLLALLDEPTANLDPLWQLRLLDLLRERICGTGRTAVVAMHDLDAAAAVADRLIVMDEGRIAADNRPHIVMNGQAMAAVFGIERAEGKWRPLSRPADRRSSP